MKIVALLLTSVIVLNLICPLCEAQDIASESTKSQDASSSSSSSSSQKDETCVINLNARRKTLDDGLPTDVVQFIKNQNAHSEFTMSNCAGSQLIGESGIAKGRRIVTYIGGGKDLQAKYPYLQVQDDQKVSFVEDGKFLSSNGNLASYISALELLEKMSDRKHRQFVESYLYLERLTGWQKPTNQSK